jgi:hypothetical protein
MLDMKLRCSSKDIQPSTFGYKALVEGAIYSVFKLQTDHFSPNNGKTCEPQPVLNLPKKNSSNLSVD